MGNYWSYEVKAVKEENKFIDPHCNLKSWVRFQYCRQSISRFNKPKVLIGR